jgi:poly(3-hydroxybutyrate) depolymerase
MKKQTFYLLICCLYGISSVNAQKYTTIQYFKDDTIQLDLDLFLPDKLNKMDHPLLIFLHGGGFSGGDKASGYDLCRFLSKRGIVAATISYTLYMKDKNFSCEGILSEKIKAIQYGVNDLWLATSFFIENSGKYHIDTSLIFIAGSSAGAESVLHAAFWDFETMNIYKNKLPETFKYAGLIEGSGALMDLNLITSKSLIPVLMFHGNSDQLVPYGTAAHHYCKTNSPGWLMLFGSYSIYNYIVALNGNAHLITYCGGGHEYSAELFERDQQPIIDFIYDIILNKKFQIHTIIPTGKKTESSSVYKFCD